MTEKSYEALRDGDPRTTDVARIAGESFGTKPEKAREFVDNAGPDNWRMWSSNSRLQGVLALYPMGQWFGGRSLPMWGVACVGIDSADRGSGVGTRLMHAAVREMHERGIALSALYPAVQSLYRRAGYERAGNAYKVELRLREIAPVDRTATLRQGSPDDEPALEALETARARKHDGAVDRSALMWRRARSPGGEATRVHVVEENGTITGYVRWRERAGRSGHYLWASEVIASTPVSARRLLAFFADHGAQIQKALWQGHATEPLLTAADSLCTKVEIADTWMLRVTDVASALCGRGYPAGLCAEVQLDVVDELCPGNAGRWVLRVEDGVGHAERGGDGRIGLDVRQLATIYSGHAHPLTIRAAHPVSGSDADLATLGSIFAGHDPWMPDGF